VEEIKIQNLDVSELLNYMDTLINDKNPYNVNRKVDSLKAIFYQKINKKDNIKSSEEKDFEIKFKAYKKKKFEYRKKQEKKENNNFNKKKNIIEEIYNITKEKESLKDTFINFKNLTNKWKEIGPVPMHMKKDLWSSYHYAIEVFYDFIKINKDLRDIDFNRNKKIKENICEQAEKLSSNKDINKSHKILQALHQEWKLTGPVKKEIRQKLWDRFKIASSSFNKKRNEYFVELKKKQKELIISKDNISKKIYQLVDVQPKSFKEWNLLTEKCNLLLKEWGEIKGLDRKSNTKATINKKTALNNFYETKKLFFNEVKEKNKAIIQKQENICLEAEKMQKNTNWEETSRKLILLQKKMNNLKYINSSKSKKINKRFKSACNVFFNAKNKRNKEKQREKNENLVKKKELLKEITNIKFKHEKKEISSTINKLLNKWSTIGQDINNKINFKISDAINKKFQNHSNNFKLEILIYKIIINENNKNKYFLKNELKELKLEYTSLTLKVHQYENNLTFFAKSNKTNSITIESEKKLSLMKEQIKKIKSKIEIINKYL